MTEGKLDPFTALAIGLNEDRKAEAKAPTKRRGTKATETAADVAAKVAEGNALAEQAPTDATTADATPSDVSASSDPSHGDQTDQQRDAQLEADQDPNDAAVAVGAFATVATVATVDTPAAPGDEPDAVLERRIDRLYRIVEEAEFEAGTALGDLTTGILDLYRHGPKVWTAMTGEEKRRMERTATVLAQQLLKRVVLVIAEEESRTLQATLSDNFGVKGEKVEGKIILEHVDGDVLLALHGMAGKRVVIVDASDARFSSSRRTTDHGNDEPGLPFESGSAPAAAPTPAAEPPLTGPEGDDDLNPGDDTGSAVDAGKASSEGEAVDWAGGGEERHDDPPPADDSADAVGIYDVVNKEWLIHANGGDDGWTDDSQKAGLWSLEEANKVLGLFEDSNLEARAIGTVEG